MPAPGFYQDDDDLYLLTDEGHTWAIGADDHVSDSAVTRIHALPHDARPAGYLLTDQQQQDIHREVARVARIQGLYQNDPPAN